MSEHAPSTAELDEQVRQEMRRRSRRGFLVGGIAAAAGYVAWRQIENATPIEGAPASYRKALEFNSRIARKFFRSGALAPEFDSSRVVQDFRRNGDIGLSDIDEEDWRLQLIGADHAEKYPEFNSDVMSWDYGWEQDDEQPSPPQPVAHEDDAKGDSVTVQVMIMPKNLPKQPGLLLTMQHIRALPKVEMTTQFKCIEGWSEIVHWGGARLSDFIAKNPPPTRDGKPFDPREAAAQIPEYVGFETPDMQYYVGIEREAALHPQTLLAYELNGQPLSMPHGAPLRLVTPLKYGIKNLKQIGRIYYSRHRPPDYWHRQGYDYYAGL